jgi:hypothetical protein
MRLWRAHGRRIIEVLLAVTIWLLLAPRCKCETLLLAAPTPSVADPISPVLDPARRLELQVDLIKQVIQTTITLTTALLAFSGSLLLWLAKHGVQRTDRWLVAAWIAMIASVMFGAGVFQALISSLDVSTRPIYSPTVLNDARIHILLFVLGFAFFLRWIWLRVKSPTKDVTHEK